MRTLKRNADGSYTTHNGWEIRKHCDTGRWNLINPETGGVFDSSEKLSDLRKVYGSLNRVFMPNDVQFMSALNPCDK